jgi:DNA-3-methyladenine glycosylase
VLRENKDAFGFPVEFYARPAQQVAPDLIGCQLSRRHSDGTFTNGVIVETEAYAQEEKACHGYRSRTKRNNTLFGPPGHWYVYLTYGIHHCVNCVTGTDDWANGVLLRAVAIPHEPPRVAAGPGLLARRFAIDRSFDAQPVHPDSGLWLSPATEPCGAIIQSARVGIKEALDLPWRWLLKDHPSVSRPVLPLQLPTD